MNFPGDSSTASPVGANVQEDVYSGSHVTHGMCSVLCSSKDSYMVPYTLYARIA